ncbi:DotU family type IV/VI secretion system protein [Mariniblastus sp.]|nr:DotU family type IV/VI secretion system protein [Mariniblastus sp.]
MTPKHSLTVDPVFLHVLNLLDRIEQGEDPNPQEEHVQIKTLLDQGEAIVGASEEWELTKYAIVSWVDEVLLTSSWAHRDWWGNNVLEVEFFNTRLCNEQFFVNAKAASQLSNRDALEVYYICVILGFRGLYQDATIASMLVAQHQLPSDLKAWKRQTAMSIRVGQGRPALSGLGREIHGAPPLSQRSSVVWPWLAAVAMATFLCVLLFQFGATEAWMK